MDVSPREAYLRARTAAARAADLDENSGEAHVSLALLAEDYDWNWPVAEREFRRSIALNPNLAIAHLGYGHLLMVLRRPEEARTELRTAQALDPVSQVIGEAVVLNLYYSRKYDEGIAQARQSLELYPASADLHYLLADNYAQKGMESLALEEYLNGDEINSLKRAKIVALQQSSHNSGFRGLLLEWLALDKELASQGHLRSYHVAIDYALLGDREQSLFWLEKAYTDRDSRLLYIALEPRFDHLRSDPRFQDLLRRLHLPQ